MSEFDKEGAGAPGLTKEEYVRLEIIKALAGRIQWPPNESVKISIEFLAGVVRGDGDKPPS